MVVQFRAEDEPVPTRADYWRHVVEDTIAPMALRVRGSSDFASRIRVGDAGPVQVTDLVVPPAELTRSPALIRHRDPDRLKIDVLLAGEALVSQDDGEAHLRPGDFCLVDLSRPCRWVNGPGRIAAISFPRTMLSLRDDDAGRLAGERLRAQDSGAPLITGLTAHLLEHLEADRDGARLGTAMLDLLTVVLAERLDSVDQVPVSTRERSLLLRIQAFITERLGDPDLSPQVIAQAHHISVRYLHRLFADQEETVAAWIRRRRLEHCRSDLRSPARREETASAIGARWGFTSPDHFSRVFRRQYGLTPRQVRPR